MEKTKKVENFRSGGGSEERRQYEKNNLLSDWSCIVRYIPKILVSAQHQSANWSVFIEASGPRETNDASTNAQNVQ